MKNTTGLSPKDKTDGDEVRNLEQRIQLLWLDSCFSINVGIIISLALFF